MRKAITVAVFLPGKLVLNEFQRRWSSWLQKRIPDKSIYYS